MTKKHKWNFNPFDGYKGNLTWLEKRTIFATVHGSQAYGTNTPESDIDVRGLCVPPREYYYGFRQNFEQVESSKPYDMAIYSLDKFFKLASVCNPNIIEILNTNPVDWLVTSELHEKLYEKRDLFLSRKARFTFSGYANSQLKRIKSHKKWLLEPPTHQPTRSEFGLNEHRKLNATEMGATQKLIDEGHQLDDNVMKIFGREQSYQAALRGWQQYQNWLRSRNEKRAVLEAKFGYDCYLDDTEFLTERGWLAYDDIVNGDKLATVRQKTGALEFQEFFDRVKKALRRRNPSFRNTK